MATKRTVTAPAATVPAPAKKSSDALVPWTERLAAAAQRAVEKERNVGTSNFITIPAGILTYKGAAIPGNSLDVVVLESVVERNYYNEPYDSDNPSTPVCFAFGEDEDDLVPHEKSEERQSDRCKGCEHDEWGTATDQRGNPTKGKACQTRRRLMLMPADALKDGAESIEKSEVAFMKIPVTSVKGWAGYVKTLSAAHGRPPFSVVTKLTAERDAKVQTRIDFDAVGMISEEYLDAIVAKTEANRAEFLKPYEKREETDSAPARKGAARGVPAKTAKPRKY